MDRSSRSSAFGRADRSRRIRLFGRAEDVGRYWAAFEQVQARALDVDTSRELIMSIGSGD
jgi:hypothetical protein